MKLGRQLVSVDGRRSTVDGKKRGSEHTGSPSGVVPFTWDVDTLIRDNSCN